MSDRIDGLVDTPEQALRYLDTVMCSDNEDMRRGAYNRVSIHIKQLAAIAREAEARALTWQLTAKNTQELLNGATARAIEKEQKYREAEANAQLREALSNALSAMRAWGAEEDGIPGDFGAWKAYCDGARLLGRDVDASDRAVEGADDE